MTTRRRLVPSAVLSAIVLVSVGALIASDPPDSKVNPQSGFVETTDSYWAGADYNVRHTISRGEGKPPIVSVLATGPEEDLGPRLAIGPAGDTWVAWWRDEAADGVFVRKRTYSSGAWDATRRVGDSSESSRHPAILNDGSQAWIVYEATVPGGTRITVAKIPDSPSPIDPLGLRTTSYAGCVDATIHSEAGHLWATWVDSGTNVGWCEYDYEASGWRAPSYESYANDSVSDARSRIRNTVLP